MKISSFGNSKLYSDHSFAWATTRQNCQCWKSIALIWRWCQIFLAIYRLIKSPIELNFKGINLKCIKYNIQIITNQFFEWVKKCWVLVLFPFVLHFYFVLKFLLIFLIFASPFCQRRSLYFPKAKFTNQPWSRFDCSVKNTWFHLRLKRFMYPHFFLIW